MSGKKIKVVGLSLCLTAFPLGLVQKSVPLVVLFYTKTLEGCPNPDSELATKHCWSLTREPVT